MPVLYVQPRQDPWGGAQELQKLCEATAGPKSIWWIEDPLGRVEAYHYVSDHLENILAFAALHINGLSF